MCIRDRAISLAIDKESLLGFALEGEGTVADKIFTKELLGDLDSQVNPLPGFDPEGAKEKLDASGVDKKMCIRDRYSGVR